MNKNDTNITFSSYLNDITIHFTRTLLSWNLLERNSELM